MQILILQVVVLVLPLMLVLLAWKCPQLLKNPLAMAGGVMLLTGFYQWIGQQPSYHFYLVGGTVCTALYLALKGR